MKASITKCHPVINHTPVLNSGLKDQAAFVLKDKDGNGTVSVKEHVAGANRKELAERYAEFKRYDTDGDGQLSKDEFVRGRAMDRLRESIQRDPKPVFKPFEAAEGGAKSEGGFFQKLIKGLAFTNPITMPFMVGNWLREKIAG